MGPKNLRTKKLQNKIDEARKYFPGEKHKTSLSLASRLLEQKNLIGCEEILNKFPTRDQLFESLVAKLKGKSIYRTLKQIHENKEIDALTKIKGVSSLMTHCIIEMQSGNLEYGMLLPVLLEKESELIFSL